MHRLSAALLAAFVLALSAAGCASLPSTVPVVSDAVYPADGLVTFLLENPNGYVNVTGWDRNEVQVRALNGRGVANVSVEVVGSQMTVRTLSTGGIGLEGPHADYEVRVPRPLPRIALTTANGAIEVDDCNGTIDAETSNGRVSVSGLALNATTTGQSEVTGTLGAGGNTLRVETSNGAITLGSL